MQLISAFLLVAHGSSDPRPQQALEQLAHRIQQQLQASGESVYVGTATLECAPTPLHEQIQQFGQQVRAVGGTRLQILPLFLLPGVHAIEDIPAEVELARPHLEPGLRLELLPYLGSHPQLGRLLASEAPPSTTQCCLLLSHGSRRPGSNQPIVALADQLGAVPAYWSIDPSLSDMIQTYIRQGYQQIQILPYFLFSGSITDVIETTIEQFSHQYPQVRFHLAPPLADHPQLADLICDLMQVSIPSVRA